MLFLANDYLTQHSVESKNSNSRSLSLSNIFYYLCNPNTRLKKKQDYWIL